MKYTVIPACKLTPNLNARWDKIQKTVPALASPYFRPEFTHAVASVRDDVFVGLLENKGRIDLFFPFHRKLGVARPIGLGLSDYHGVVATPDAEWSAEGLLRGCKLDRWEYDHLPVDQYHFNKYHVETSDSPIIDVSQGMEAFEASRDKAGRKQLRETQRKSKKLAEEVGPLTFTLHSPSRDILRQLMAWKSQQCQSTGTVDYFAIDWCAKLIERIHETRDHDFGGILCCLHAGETLAAVHFVMYSRYVWHSWFPAYNHVLEEYSPGSILLLKMIEAASERNIRYIDLGKGLSLYKKRVMTGGIPVAEGCLALPSFRNRARRIREIAEGWAKQSILSPVLRIPGRIIKGKERKRRYE
jgi:CelD/BcsL family acetyltransferase involved in cellulose biosynthesis